MQCVLFLCACPRCTYAYSQYKQSQTDREVEGRMFSPSPWKEKKKGRGNRKYIFITLSEGIGGMCHPLPGAAAYQKIRYGGRSSQCPLKGTSQLFGSVLSEWREGGGSICHLLEVTAGNTEYANGLLRMNVIDEIILYVVPTIDGNGAHFSSQHYL